MRRKHTAQMICTLAIANTALYGLPYMKGQFYDILLDSLNLTHTQLSTLFSIYGAVCMAAYLLGGVLTDCVSLKKLMTAALIVSGLLHLYAMTIPGYAVLCVIFGALALTSVFAFYPASMKMLTYLGGEDQKGTVFGTYISIINITGTIVVGIGLLILIQTGENLLVFRVITGLYGILHFVAAFLLNMLFQEKNEIKGTKQIEWKKLIWIVRNRNVWQVVIMVFCNYLLIAVMTYTIPYLSQVYQMSDTSVLALSILRVNVITILISPFAGVIVDKVGSAIRFISATFLCCLGLGAGMLASLYVSIPVGLVALFIILITVVCTAGKSVNMVAVSEIGISETYLGTVIGLVSFVGYSPDAFFYTMAGRAIDTFGLGGYEMIFILFLVCSGIGLVSCCIPLKKIEKGVVQTHQGNDEQLPVK